MDYDSRRWTGRYAPGEAPPGWSRPYRSHSLRWTLLAIIALTLALAIVQVRFDIGEGIAPMFVAGLSVAAGRSPFARGRGRDYDEFERQALMQAHRRAYAAISTLAVLAMAWCAVASRYHWPMPDGFWDWATWVAALLIVASNLPAMLAEFAIPFPDQEDAA